LAFAGVGRAPSPAGFDLDFAGVIDAASSLQVIFQSSSNSGKNRKQDQDQVQNQLQNGGRGRPPHVTTSVVRIAAVDHFAGDSGDMNSVTVPSSMLMVIMFSCRWR
jgi:hypothetical protein